MKRDAERIDLIKNLFDHALKIKISKLARKYDPDLVLKFWAQMAKINKKKPRIDRWRWNPDMTLTEAMDRLDDYYSALETLIQKRQAKSTKTRR